MVHAATHTPIFLSLTLGVLLCSTQVSDRAAGNIEHDVFSVAYQLARWGAVRIKTILQTGCITCISLHQNEGVTTNISLTNNTKIQISFISSISKDDYSMDILTIFSILSIIQVAWRLQVCNAYYFSSGIKFICVMEIGWWIYRWLLLLQTKRRKRYQMIWLYCY